MYCKVQAFSWETHTDCQQGKTSDSWIPEPSAAVSFSVGLVMGCCWAPLLSSALGSHFLLVANGVDGVQDHIPTQRTQRLAAGVKLQQWIAAHSKYRQLSASISSPSVSVTPLACAAQVLQLACILAARSTRQPLSSGLCMPARRRHVPLPTHNTCSPLSCPFCCLARLRVLRLRALLLLLRRRLCWEDTSSAGQQTPARQKQQQDRSHPGRFDCSCTHTQTH